MIVLLNTYEIKLLGVLCAAAVEGVLINLARGLRSGASSTPEVPVAALHLAGASPWPSTCSTRRPAMETAPSRPPRPLWTGRGPSFGQPDARLPPYYGPSARRITGPNHKRFLHNNMYVFLS